MLSFTIKLITMAASNSFVIFCFCNFIIAILLVGGSRTASKIRQGIPIPSITAAERSQNGIVETNPMCLLNKKAVIDEEEGDEEDEELRRRVEEFIDKINKGWKAEKPRA
ncbi:hypothetical protein NMG60_11012289 [Bertholletia excelsa]